MTLHVIWPGQKMWRTNLSLNGPVKVDSVSTQVPSKSTVCILWRASKLHADLSQSISFSWEWIGKSTWHANEKHHRLVIQFYTPALHETLNNLLFVQAQDLSIQSSQPPHRSLEAKARQVIRYIQSEHRFCNWHFCHLLRFKTPHRCIEDPQNWDRLPLAVPASRSGRWGRTTCKRYKRKAWALMMCYCPLLVAGLSL